MNKLCRNKCFQKHLKFTEKLTIYNDIEINHFVCEDDWTANLRRPCVQNLMIRFFGCVASLITIIRENVHRIYVHIIICHSVGTPLAIYIR